MNVYESFSSRGAGGMGGDQGNETDPNQMLSKAKSDNGSWFHSKRREPQSETEQGR